MADAIFGIVGQILIQMGSDAVKEIGSAIGVTKELKKLEKTLSTIEAVFKDADEQQLTSHELTNWFKLIKDAMYEAEDIIDDFATEALRQKLRIQESSLKKVRSFAYSIKSGLSFDMSRRIKEVRQKFDEIAADKDKFHLLKSVSRKRVGKGQTYSFVVEEEVFGRDGDRDEIVELLSDADGELVVAIIGMAGLGKTTLAQLVYNHKAVDSQFELKMWVSVSQEFDVKKITENAIKSARKKECPNLEMDQLQSLLREDLKEKRFLLVLDDVWNEDSERWDKLKMLFTGSVKGSKIVVTTRSAKVASIMGARPHSLKAISDDDCWKLFRERAFVKGEAEKQPNLVTIGKEMVNKCHGVPLAAKTLGSLMRFQTKEHEWVNVNNNDVWRLPQGPNDILPALRLSYNHLPFHLKPCFTYCVALHKGSEYPVWYMIAAWIAQGFVYTSDKSQCLEDIGHKYVQELLCRSLFSEPVEDYYGNLDSFKVHDLVHNLAQDVVGTEVYVFEGAVNVQNEEEVRHVNLYECPPSLASEVVCKMPNLRTLIFNIEFLAGDIFSNFKSIRQLTLHKVSGSLPSGIGKLMHLRMLCIESMDIQTLPNSITKLLNLQTLHLVKCPKLTELPNGIGRMINLRHIYIDDDAPISSIPQGLGNLASLQTLSLFVVSKGTGCKLKELQGLIHLDGTMTIKNLQNITRVRDCEDANLKQKKLEHLELIWDGQEGEGNTNGAEIHVSVLEKLEPHSNLEELTIVGYRGSEFPGWIMEPVFPRLKAIKLGKCRECECLPTFGQLPSLEILALEDMDALRCIEGNCTTDRRQAKWFPSLKSLLLERIPNLESWNLGDEENLALFSLPCLVVLKINGCPKLRNIPLLPSIESLEVKGCSGKLIHLLLKQVQASLIKNLTIQRCDDLESLPGLQGLSQLQTLIIEECPRLVHLSDDDLGILTSLMTLEIQMLPELVSLPQWVENATNLQNLRINDCEGLIHLLDSFGQLNSVRLLLISNCPKVQSLPDGIQQLTTLETLYLYSDGLMSWLNGLRNLTSLRDLRIMCSANLPYLPEELNQLSALHVLGIGRCQTLQILPEYMKNFTSLQELYVFQCQNLQCLPEWISRLTALETLYIYNCEKLTSRCKKEIGEDWHKIGRIPNIVLNGESLDVRRRHTISTV